MKENQAVEKSAIYEKLSMIQQKLIAPKTQRNNFGNYNYRSCEDILEAVKPHLKANKVILTLSDDLVAVGERYYVKATATLTDCDTGDSISNTAYAREEEKKTGMSESQITGACSSYARKYALNGLFCIDDVKDADARENIEEDKSQKSAPATTQTTAPAKSTVTTTRKSALATKKMTEEIVAKCIADNIPVEEFCKLYKIPDIQHLEQRMYKNAVGNWEKLKANFTK